MYMKRINIYLPEKTIERIKSFKDYVGGDNFSYMLRFMLNEGLNQQESERIRQDWIEKDRERKKKEEEIS